MSNQILQHLHPINPRNDLLCNLQSSYRKFHSCKSAILYVSDDVRDALDVNEAVILTHFYGDDTQIYNRCKLVDLPQTINLINDDLKNVSDWSILNGLSINTG
ncbi:hypothetical protein ACFFRR_010102 [Megaselia abdita]